MTLEGAQGDGERYWLRNYTTQYSNRVITINHVGYIIGGGFHDADRDPASFLRLGNVQQDGVIAAPEVKNLTCGDYSAQGAPVDPTPYEVQFRYDRKAHPWSIMDAVRVSNGSPPGFNLDPEGQAMQGSAPSRVQIEAQGRDARVFPQRASEISYTDYGLRDGRLVWLRQIWRHSEVYCQ